MIFAYPTRLRGPAAHDSVKRFLYNCLFNVGFGVTAPFYLLKMARRGDWSRGFGERFGRYDNRLKHALTNREVIWFHAVSVGEANLVTQLIQALEKRLPIYKFVVSTTTSTGMGILRSRLPDRVSRIYYPIDRRKHVQRAMGTIHPGAVVLVEAEIWPNFLWSLRRRKVPYFLINARISDRSFRGYRRFGFLFRELFEGFTVVTAQNEADAARLRELGVRAEAIHVVGSLKFDAAKLDPSRRLDVERLLKKLGVGSEAQVLVGGSTHAGEEAILADLVRRLRPRFPRLFLVLVPRHHERGREVGDELKRRGINFVYRTELTEGHQRGAGSVECLLVNTTGELRFFYERADVVFVGKSLTAMGGQNPIEPAALGKAVVFGPHMENFPQVVPQFLAAGGALQVPDAAGLERAIEGLLGDPVKRQEIGRRGQEVVRLNEGALLRTVELIAQNVKQR